MRLALLILLSMVLSAQAPMVLTGNSVIRNAVIASAAASGNDPVFNSLTHYWALDEASGTRSDSKGSVNFDEDGGTISSATGIKNGCADMTGVVGRRLLSSAWSTASAFSLALWIKPSQRTSAQPEVLFEKADPTAGGDWSWDLLLKGSTGGVSDPIVVLETIGDGSVDQTGAISSSSWHLIVLTSDGGLVTVYVDGNVAFGPSSWTINAPGGSGTSAINDGSVPLSLVDEVAIWNIALTSGNVTTLWSGGSGVFYRP